MSAPSSARCAAGERAQSVAAGDVILTHRPGLIPRLIRLGQRRRFRGDRGAFAYWSHAAVIVDPDGSLVEAETRGVKLSPLAKYDARQYHLVRTGALLPDHGAAAVAYARAQVGQAFGFLELSAIAVWLITGVRVHWQRRDHQICSGLVARALQESGWQFDRDPAFMLPADLAESFGVKP